MTFRRILVPVDMSEFSRAALEVAADLARTGGAELHLLNAYGLSASEYPYMVYVHFDEIQREVASVSRKELDRWKERFAPADLDVEVHTSRSASPSFVVS